MDKYNTDIAQIVGFFVGNDCANNYNFGLSSLGESDLEGSNKILRSISKNLYITLSLSLSISFSLYLSLSLSPFVFQIPFCRCGFHSIPKSPTNMIPKTVTLLSDATGKSFKDTALSEEESLFEMLTMS